MACKDQRRNSFQNLVLRRQNARVRRIIIMLPEPYRALQRFNDGEWDGAFREYFYEDGSKERAQSLFVRLSCMAKFAFFWESGTPKRSVRYEDGVFSGRFSINLWNEKRDPDRRRRNTVQEARMGTQPPLFCERRLKRGTQLFFFQRPVLLTVKEWDENRKNCISKEHLLPTLTLYGESLFRTSGGQKSAQRSLEMEAVSVWK